MAATSIEWTDRSVNPIRARLGDAVGHHCEKVSPGCANCYASTLQSRFQMPPFQADHRAGVVPFFEPKVLREVLTRRKPTKWFWCDMSDLFGSWVPDEWIDQCFAVMALTPRHTHQVLTKRPERMREYCSRLPNRGCNQFVSVPGYGSTSVLWGHMNLQPWPLPNVWLGTSVENEDTLHRVDTLKDTPAAVRFVSFEPLLEDLGAILLDEIDWAIVGGESGRHARPCDVSWVRSIVQQCDAASVPCFVKQLGKWPSSVDEPNGVRWGRLVDKDGTPSEWAPYTGGSGKHGDPSGWPIDLRVREFPNTGATL